MPEFTIEIEARCNECGSALSADSSKRNGNDVIFVHPCEKCLRAAKDEGDTEGYDRATEDAKE
jgi:hypothetical protein